MYNVNSNPHKRSPAYILNSKLLPAEPARSLVGQFLDTSLQLALLQQAESRSPGRITSRTTPQTPFPLTSHAAKKISNACQRTCSYTQINNALRSHCNRMKGKKQTDKQKGSPPTCPAVLSHCLIGSFV